MIAETGCFIYCTWIITRFDDDNDSTMIYRIETGTPHHRIRDIITTHQKREKAREVVGRIDRLRRFYRLRRGLLSFSEPSVTIRIARKSCWWFQFSSEFRASDFLLISLDFSSSENRIILLNTSQYDAMLKYRIYLFVFSGKFWSLIASSETWWHVSELSESYRTNVEPKPFNTSPRYSPAGMRGRVGISHWIAGWPSELEVRLERALSALSGLVSAEFSKVGK